MSSRRHLLSASLAVCLLTLAAPAASASAVKLDHVLHCGYPGQRCDTAATAWQITFRAAPGEANRVRVTREGDTVTLRDPGGVIAIAPPDIPEERGRCVAPDRTLYKVACDVSPAGDFEKLVAVRVVLGDGDDRLSFAAGIFAGAESLATYTRISGGDGDDVLGGTAEYDVISGGAGADAIASGAGRDRISAGTGRNRISAGAGSDSVSSRNRARDVVNCGSGRDTARSDRGDRLRGCEGVRASR